MKEISLKNLLDEIKLSQKRLTFIKEVVKKMENYFNENGIKFPCFIGINPDLNIEGKSKDLIKIRRMLKSIFGEWQDHICHIFDCCGPTLLYKSKDPELKDLIYIRINYEKEEDLPKSITKNGKCGFKEIPAITKTWACETEVNND